MQQADPVSLIYASLGSEAPIFKLVDEFYLRVEKDAILRPIYPDDLSEAKQHLSLFLVQRLGGRTTYSDERGHPRMRQRHMRFKIGQAEKDAWLACMFAALDKVQELSVHKEVLRFYFADFAAFLVNQPG